MQLVGKIPPSRPMDGAGRHWVLIASKNPKLHQISLLYSPNLAEGAYNDSLGLRSASMTNFWLLAM